MGLTAEDLLLGGSATFTVTIPAHVLRPAAEAGTSPAPAAAGGTVVIRPLTLLDVQRIQKAAQEQNGLTSVLMVQFALVEPKLGIEQVNRLHAGVVEFLLREVNRVSGLALGGDELETMVQAPLARACFVLAREFGWTPEECASLTLGQILLYLEMLGRGEAPARGPAVGPAPQGQGGRAA